MSVREVLWRLRRGIADAMPTTEGTVAPGANLDAARLRPWPAPSDIDPASYATRAEEIGAGIVQLFGEPVRIDSRAGLWNRDPMSGVDAPMVTGTRIDYRDARVVGNARNVWELNRHFQLVELAQAWALTGDVRHRDEAERQISGWLGECPYPIGVNWVSALEHGIRLINWKFASRLLGWWQRGGAEPVAGWASSIYWHCRFIWEHQSRYSSANNHLIGEMAGLYVAAAAWPFWAESARWRADARRILLREVERQTHPDGVTREQTVGYQMFVLQLLVAAGLAGEEVGEPFPAEFWNAFRRMVGFLRSIADRSGNLPQFGDSDDGIAFVLSPTARDRRFQDLLDVEALWSGARQPTGDSAAVWFASGYQKPKHWPDAELSDRRAFESGGYFVLGHRLGEADEARLVFDAAPLGYLSIAAHGHADCLSFTLSVAGEELLIDPGTFCYHSDARWRDYFRSTAAHNTIRVDATDQSEMAGPFMWLRRAEPTVHEQAVEARQPHIVASHDGYRRLRDPVVHRRGVTMQGDDRRILVADTLECRGSHGVERWWQAAEHCAVTRVGARTVEIAGRRSRLRIIAEDADEVALIRSDELLPSGWVSRRFGAREATTSVVFRNSIAAGCTLKTMLEWEVMQ